VSSEEYNTEDFPISELPQSYDTQKVGETNPLHVYISSESNNAYFQSEKLESLVGFDFKDVAELLDKEYGTRLEGSDIESFEYGNGWAMVSFE
jgi:hypothetical protein